MSRSYKKTPYAGDKKDKKIKKIFNHSIRQKLKNSGYSLSYNDFKKIKHSWNICDYCEIGPQTPYKYYLRTIENWYKWHSGDYDYPTIEESYKEYYKLYKHK